MASGEILKNEELLLTALSGGSELYGLQMLNLIEEASDREIIINYGSLYPLLKKLEKNGYITSRWENDSDRKGARRRYYRITKEGIALVDRSQLLRERLKQLATVTTPVDSSLLRVFDFEVVTVNRRGEIIKRVPQQARYFREELAKDITLDMVEIPGGTFMMGSPEGEGDKSEHPQHEVTVQPFFMGKYPVTQAQWRVVANFPKVKYNLKPVPSRLKGDNLPVERVWWCDAVEFCDRLSRKFHRQYRLPSEAEWEYACRARTSTPFHFGETITSELANYNATEIYAEEAKGKYRGKTTSVGCFYPNAFGLYDMHGNILEWCVDDWHQNYKGAPIDGTAWLSENHIGNNDNRSQVLRSGAWGDDPDYCRSAFRDYFIARGVILFNVGFRLVCVASRT